MNTSSLNIYVVKSKMICMTWFRQNSSPIS